jgi:hypothetical protein
VVMSRRCMDSEVKISARTSDNVTEVLTISQFPPDKHRNIKSF